MQIIQATEIHLNQIFLIYNHAILHGTATFDTIPKTDDEIEQWWAKHNHKFCVYVAIIKDDVAGWASLSQWSDKLAYNNSAELSVYIQPQYQGKKIGNELIKTILQKGKEEGIHTVISRITEGNNISIHLHEKYGFTHVGVLKQVGQKFGQLLDVTLMQKIL